MNTWSGGLPQLDSVAEVGCSTVSNLIRQWTNHRHSDVRGKALRCVSDLYVRSFS
jgi:hypothetical protein